MFWAARTLNCRIQRVISLTGRFGYSFKSLTWWRLIIAIIDHERGIPSKRESSARVDYVPALCTHHPSPLTIEWFSKVFELALSQFHWQDGCWKVNQTWSFQGSKSRNKVSIGEPAEASLPFVNMTKTHCEQYQASGFK